MIRCTPEVLESYLHRYGWSFKAREWGCWVSGWQGKDRSYPLVIQLCDTWLTFSVAPFFRLSEEWEDWPEIATFLLRLNQYSDMVRFAVADDNSIQLISQVYAAGLSFDAFADTLGIIGHFADEFYDALLHHFDRVGYRYAPSLRLLT